MPEAEFEMYLNVLSQLMRLNSQQRAAIADELRDHLEARLTELMAAGHSREEAVRMALNDVGDAASLATDFQNVIAHKRRKRVVRYSLVTVVAMMVALFVASAFWPVPRNLAPDSVVAQGQSETQSAKDSSSTPQSAKRNTFVPVAPVVSGLQRRLDTKITAPLQFKATKFNEVMAALQKATGIDMWVDPCPGEPTAMEFPVTLDLPASKYSVRTALEVILDQTPDRFLDYRILDDLLIISRKEYVEVYDCRDLLASFPESAKLAVPFVKTPDTKPKGGGFGDGSHVTTLGGRKLTEVIQGIVVMDSWTDHGGSATIDEFNGLLTVYQSPRGHRELRGLLKLMRERLKERRESASVQGNGQAVTEVAEKERGCEPGSKTSLLCLDTPPSVDEVIRALPDDVARNNVRIVMEPIVDKLESCRVYPLVGPARLHKVHYKCTVYFDKVAARERPIQTARTDQGKEVVYIDHNHLIRCASLTAGGE